MNNIIVWVGANPFLFLFDSYETAQWKRCMVLCPGQHLRAIVMAIWHSTGCHAKMCWLNTAWHPWTSPGIWFVPETTLLERLGVEHVVALRTIYDAAWLVWCIHRANSPSNQKHWEFWKGAKWCTAFVQGKTLLSSGVRKMETRDGAH